MPGVINFHGNFSGLLLHSLYLHCFCMDLSTYSLTFSVCFSYILKFVEEVALELLVRWDLNVIFLKEKRMACVLL